MTRMRDDSALGREEIAAGLRRLGLRTGERVMVHSSLSNLGYVAGGAATVVAALQEVLTPEGTVMMPSFNHGRCCGPGGPGYFDVKETPTTNGAIPETFRRMAGVRRSWHPTHAVAAWGRDAQRYTEGHHRVLTCGPGSPLAMLADDGGRGLLLGVTYKANTYHHVVEMTTGAPCLGRRTRRIMVKLPDGRMVEGRTWGWRQRACPITDAARYAPAMAAGHERRGRVGAAEAILFGYRECFEVVARMLREGLGEYPPCRRCPIQPRADDQNAASDWDDAAGRLRPDSPAWSY